MTFLISSLLLIYIVPHLPVISIHIVAESFRIQFFLSIAIMANDKNALQFLGALKLNYYNLNSSDERFWMSDSKNQCWVVLL